ncbi:hypothetical protein OAS19_02440 [Altererythrobacter sp.]|nr:hypothetical protein [Altererythrobacter sp.]
MRVSPSQAHLLAPWHGPIAAKLAQQQIAAGVFESGASDPTELARMALIRDATAVGALNVLAVQAQINNDTEVARSIFSYSLAMTRRELQPRLWAIEEAALRGDIDEALRNYDIALRTSKSSYELLYPVLAASIAEPIIRDKVVKMVAQDPPWNRTFIDFVATSGIDPKSGVAFFTQGEAAGLPITDENRAFLTNMLLNNGSPVEAWAYYASFREGARIDRLSDGAFSQTFASPTGFDWITRNDSGFATTIAGTPGAEFLELSVASSISGEIVHQARVLPPGRYQLSGTSSIDAGGQTKLSWNITCRENGEVLGRVDIRASSEPDGKFKGQFEVPQGCLSQLVSLSARASDNPAGILGRIDDVNVRPVQTAR